MRQWSAALVFVGLFLVDKLTVLSPHPWVRYPLYIHTAFGMQDVNSTVILHIVHDLALYEAFCSENHQASHL